jgi:hypothetical protein
MQNSNVQDKKENTSQTPLGILAGNGSLPLYIAERTIKSGRDVFILGINATADPKIENYPHTWLKWGEVDKLFKTLKKQNVKQLLFIGGVSRPDFKDIHFDFGMIRNLPFVFSLTMGGDDSVLTNIVNFVESKGVSIVGAHEIAPELTADRGVLTKKSPSKVDRKDIEKGIKTVLSLGEMDIGQGAVVAREYVLCVEAAEGTDNMLDRAKGLRQWGKGWLNKKNGVLVKLPKPSQELRIDMPTIGPKTIELVAGAGLNGIAVVENKVLMSEKQKTIDLANKLGVFIIGLPETDLNP